MCPGVSALGVPQASQTTLAFLSWYQCSPLSPSSESVVLAQHPDSIETPNSLHDCIHIVAMGNTQSHRGGAHDRLSAHQELDYMVQRSKELHTRRIATYLALQREQRHQPPLLPVPVSHGLPPAYTENALAPIFYSGVPYRPVEPCPHYTKTWEIPEAELIRRKSLYRLRWAHWVRHENRKIARRNGNRWRLSPPHAILSMSIALEPLLDVRTGTPIYDFPATVLETHAICEARARLILEALGEGEAARGVGGTDIGQLRTALRRRVMDLGLKGYCVSTL